MELTKLHDLFESLCNVAVVGLLLFAVGSIVVFFKVFQSDLNQD